MSEYERGAESYPPHWVGDRAPETVPVPEGVIACGPGGRVTELPPEDVAAVQEFSAELELLTKANAIITRLDALAEEQAKVEAEQKFLRARLSVLFPIGTSKVGERSVSIRENRRFDAARAAEVLTATEREMCSVPTISRKLCQENLAPARYAECQTVSGDPVVRVS
jgi:hypothetical protein